MSWIIDTFGSIISGIFAFITFVFYIICVVYFFLTLEYTRFLVNEKCKCSEDIRRELIMAGSIIEITIILLIFMVIIILPIIFNSVTIIVQNIDTVEKEVSTAVRNPYASIRSIPKKLKKATKIVSDIGSQSKKGLKKILTSPKRR
jgi:predicted PurR-regulated permease PerM